MGAPAQRDRIHPDALHDRLRDVNTSSRRCIFAATQHNHTHSHGRPKPARIGVPPPNRLLFQDRMFSLFSEGPRTR